MDLGLSPKESEPEHGVAMNTDIRLKTDIMQHHKIIKLRKKFGAAGVLAFISLLLYAGVHRTKGTLSDMDNEDIAIAAMWDGDADKLVDTLHSLRLLDKDGVWYSIHDWAEHNPWAFGAKERSEQAKKAANKRWDGERKKASPENPDEQGDPCGSHESALPSASNRIADTANEHCGIEDYALHSASIRNAPSPSPSPSPKPEPQTNTDSTFSPISDVLDDLDYPDSRVIADVCTNLPDRDDYDWLNRQPDPFEI
jgi:hypothetical protein